MTTVRQVIDLLMQCEDLDSSIIFEYYVKDHWEDSGVDSDTWEKVAERLSDLLVNDDKAFEVEKTIKKVQNEITIDL